MSGPVRPPAGWIIHDISQFLGLDASVYPGDGEPLISTRIEHDPYLRMGELSCILHAGTHIDAPAHFFPAGATIDAYPLDRLVVPCLVVDMGMETTLLASAMAGPGEGRALLFRRNTGKWTGDGSWNALPESVAQACVTARITLVGIDAPSVDAYGDLTAPAHRVLLGAGIPIIENLRLDQVAAGEYLLVCAPLPIHGTEAAPARVWLWGPPN